MADDQDDIADTPTATGVVGEATDTPAQAPPTVRRVGEWHLVTANNYQVSIGPDALVMLPRHLHPRDIPDFISALSVAADVANDVYTGNIEMGKNDDRSLAQRKAIVTAGGGNPIPQGAVRMKVAQRQSDQATIGRPNRRGRGARSSVPAQASAVKAQQPDQLTRKERAARERLARKQTAEGVNAEVKAPTVKAPTVRGRRTQQVQDADE